MFFVVAVVVVVFFVFFWGGGGVGVWGVGELIIIMAPSQPQPTLRAAPAVQTKSSVLTLVLPSTCGTGSLKTAV